MTIIATDLMLCTLSYSCAGRITVSLNIAEHSLLVNSKEKYDETRLDGVRM